jgi:hypothetical protein
MFGFGTIFCVLGEHRVSKAQARPLTGRKDVAVCDGCRAKWRQAGAVCGRCKVSVDGDSGLGVLPDRYALGHLSCGAIGLVAGGITVRPNGR